MRSRESIIETCKGEIQDENENTCFMCRVRRADSGAGAGGCAHRRGAGQFGACRHLPRGGLAGREVRRVEPACVLAAGRGGRACVLRAPGRNQRARGADGRVFNRVCVVRGDGRAADWEARRVRAAAHPGDGGGDACDVFAGDGLVRVAAADHRIRGAVRLCTPVFTRRHFENHFMRVFDSQTANGSPLGGAGAINAIHIKEAEHDREGVLEARAAVGLLG